MPYKYSQLENRLNYAESKNFFNMKKHIIHIGQLKLMMSDMHFLAKYVDPEREDLICLVVGSATGEHFKKLSELFPKIMFHLYDPAKFTVVETPKIKLFHAFFTDRDALHYKAINKQVLFISDIRNMPDNYEAKFLRNKKALSIELEANIKEDMKM